MTLADEVNAIFRAMPFDMCINEGMRKKIAAVFSLALLAFD